MVDKSGRQELFNNFKPTPSVPVPLAEKFTEGGTLQDFKSRLPSGINLKQTFIETPIVGACVGCNVVGRLDIPVDMNPNVADRVIDGKTIRVFCDYCKRMQEMRAVRPEELKLPDLHLLQRSYRALKAATLGGGELPPLAAGFLKAYEERFVKAGPQAVAEQIGKPEEGSKIIIP